MAYVNYVREHMAFIEFASDKNLTGNERTFWYALIHIANQRANGSDWPEGFISIPNSRLLGYVPFSANKIPELRNRLKQLGLIDFRKGERNKRAPEYRINYFYAELSTGNPLDAESYHRNGDNSGNNFGINSGNNFGNLNVNLYDKPNRNQNRNPNAYTDDDEEEEEETRAHDALEDRVDSAFRAAMGRSALPAERRQIAMVAINLGMDADMIEQAVGRAAKMGARSPAAYAAEMMRRWSRDGVRTMQRLVEQDCM